MAPYMTRRFHSFQAAVDFEVPHGFMFVGPYDGCLYNYKRLTCVSVEVEPVRLLGRLGGGRGGSGHKGFGC